MPTNSGSSIASDLSATPTSVSDPRTARDSAAASQIIRRLQIENYFQLVADADEPAVRLPDTDQWEQRLEGAETDESISEVLEHYDLALDKLQASWTPVGGPFDSPKLRCVDGDLLDIGLFPAPPLLALKPYVSRILIKVAPLAYRIVLVMESTPSPEFTKEVLIRAGNALREALTPVDIAGAEENGKASKKERRNKTGIAVELLLIGDQLDNDSNRRFLKGLHQRFSPSDFIFISGYILDTASNRVWTSSLPWNRRRQRYFAYALNHRNESCDSIRERMDSQSVNLTRVALAAVTGLVLMVSGRAAFAWMGLDDGFALVDALAPTLATAYFVGTMRVKTRAFAQAAWSYIAYFLPYYGAMFLIHWPISFDLALYLGQVTLVSLFLCYLVQLAIVSDG